MTPEVLSDLVLSAIAALVADGEIAVEVPATVAVERPKSREHGDYATNAALVLAKQAGMAPRDLAALIRQRLLGSAGVAAVEIAGPGFLNVTVDRAAQGELARQAVLANRGSLDRLMALLEPLIPGPEVS